jgi:hypothetical protein
MQVELQWPSLRMERRLDLTHPAYRKFDRTSLFSIEDYVGLVGKA